MKYLEKGSPVMDLSDSDLKTALFDALNKIGEKNKVLAIPPDYTRLPSKAGILTSFAYDFFGEKLTDILPVLGIHNAMTDEQIKHMFPNVDPNLFRVHDWSNDFVTIGEVPSPFVEEVSDGKVNFNWPAQVNQILIEGGYDLILFLDQVVPREVVGMANCNKNIFVGTGGFEGINKSIYRTRMPMADGGELIVFAPALKEVGEYMQIDKLIRKYGYKGTLYTLKMVEEKEDLQQNLGAVAHLIHSSCEERFSITYCPSMNPENLTKEEIESVGFIYANIDEMQKNRTPKC